MFDSVRRHRIVLPDRGVDIAVLEWPGDGPAVLMHHANGFHAALWDPCAQLLRARYRVFAMDARGHGDSSRPEGEGAFAWEALAGDLAAVGRELRDGLAGEKFALGIGHSFGGTLTLAAAARDPGLFERIFLIDPVLFPSGGSGLESMAGARRRSSVDLAARARRRRQRWVSREAAHAYLGQRELFARWDPRALDLYVQEGLRATPDGEVELKCAGDVEASIFDRNGSLDVFSEAAGLALPARLYWARRGNFPRALYEAIAARMDRATIEDADVGHLVPMEDPRRVCDAIFRFADERF